MGRPPAHPKLTDEAWLREKYERGLLTDREIARELDCDQATVGNWRERHGIRTINGTRGNELETSLPVEARQIIEGELLGDGSLSSQWSGTSHYAVFSYGTAKEAYRDWLADRFEDWGFTLSRYSSEQDAFGKPTISYRFTTNSYRYLGELHEKWYGTEKILPSDFEISPRALRHWYIGDGSLGTDRWGHEDPRITSKALAEPYVSELRAQLAERGIETSRYDGSIAILRRSREQFFDYMAPLPEELQAIYGYKWHTRSHATSTD